MGVGRRAVTAQAPLDALDPLLDALERCGDRLEQDRLALQRLGAALDALQNTLIVAAILRCAQREALAESVERVLQGDQAIEERVEAGAHLAAPRFEAVRGGPLRLWRGWARRGRRRGSRSGRGRLTRERAHPGAASQPAA